MVHSIHSIRKHPPMNIKNLLLFASFVLLSLVFIVYSVAASNETDAAALSSTHSSIHIGVILDLDSPMGAMLDLCLSMAHSDFYLAHSNYQTRLYLHPKNAEGELGVASAAVELLKNEEVHGLLGPEWLTEAAFAVELAARAHVPVISFTAKSRVFSPIQSPYFVRTTPDDLYQVKGLAAICQRFEWHQVVIIYEETHYGHAFISKLNKAFQEVDIRIAYMSAVSTTTGDVHITKELNKLMTMQTRVFLVHTKISLGYIIFDLARKAGMMTEGYAWLITDSLSNFLNSEDSTSVEGVLGTRPYVPKSNNLENFKARWRKNALLMKPGITMTDLNIYGLWAYDTVWALAMAIEKILPINSDLQRLSQGENGSEISNFRVSKIGQRLLSEISHTKFKGLSGKFQLVDGQLQPSAFEIFNVIGTGDRTVGYWTPDRGISKNLGSTSPKELKAIMWPGDTLVPPRGWAIPSNGKFKVGVPKKEGFTEFVKVQIDPLTNEPHVSGFSIDVFLASLQLLPFKLDFEFVPFINASGQRNGSYSDMLHKILDQTYDFVVGDITILADRAAYVDFTLPYTESGVVIIVKNRRSIDMWIFLKPLRWDLWLAIFVACILIEFVLRIMERERNNNGTASVPHGQQVGLFCFPVAALAFPERNMVANNWSRFVLVVWLFVAFILMQSYTAKLSSIFTVDQLDFALSEDYYVGHQFGSFVRDFLINELHINSSRLKNYTRFEDYNDAMSRGSRKGGIDAIVGEVPYMKLFLNRYGSEYRIVGRTYKTHGFGFAFPIGSPLVSYFSRAILNITQGPNMTMIEQKNFGPGYSSDPIDRDNPNLTAYNFGGLFIIICSATMFALFCSETSVGRRYTTMASHYSQRCCSFQSFRGKKSSVHSINDRDATGESSSEEVNEIQESNTNALDRPGEVQESETSNADVSAGEIEVPESNQANTNIVSAGPAEVQQPEPTRVYTSELSAADVSGRS